MARLAIYNGSTLVREVELTDGTLRVGRSDQNDIVLVDPAKAVSRFHAEIRVEGAACTIVDLNSQNGIWVAGRRVPQTVLPPGQAVLLGTYRLVFEAGALEQYAPERTMAMAAAPEGPAVPASEPTPPAAPAAPPPIAPTPSPDAATGEPPPAAHTAPKGGPHQPVRAKAAGRGHRTLVLVAAAICLAVAGVAGGIFWWPSTTGSPASVRTPDEAPPQDVLGGPPTEVPAALGAAGEPAAATGEAPAESPAAAAAAATAVRPADVPAPSAAPRSSGSTKPPGSTVAGATRPRRSTPAPPRKELAPSPASAPEPKVQVNTAQLLDQARSAIARGDHVAAAGFLDPVMRFDAGNPDALELLASVRAEGHEAYKRGRQFDAVGRTPDAVAMYDKAVKLLPPDHPSARAAKERISALR